MHFYPGLIFFSVLFAFSTGLHGNRRTDLKALDHVEEEHAVGKALSPYELTGERLGQIRQNHLYPFYDKGGFDYQGDYLKNVRDNRTQITRFFGFELPFFGMRFNYTWVSLDGYLGFSFGPTEPPTYPLEFPIKDYPRQADPSFIGPFYSKCKIGKLADGDMDSRKPGVYFRKERDLTSRVDSIAVEIRERVKLDIWDGIVGADWFEPRHVIIVTWKNVTFAGGPPEARQTTNTFQTVIATDEVRTYVIFNYEHLSWTSHAEGTSASPAFIGFNAGNGTRAFEYKPYSQASTIQDVLKTGNVNNFPGRHIFRVDEKILPGQCIPNSLQNMTTDQLNQLTIAPESGNMLGGTIVNVTGPCFDRHHNFTCRFHDTTVPGAVINENRGSCIMPTLFTAGFIDLSLELNDIVWRGRFFVESPSAAPALVRFKDDNEHLETRARNDAVIPIRWDYRNLSVNTNTSVSINLWAYTENENPPHLVHIKTLAEGISNSGEHVLSPEDFNRNVTAWDDNLVVGLITLNFTNPINVSGMPWAPVLWSKPMPLTWYMWPTMEEKHGRHWSEKLCKKWIDEDRKLNDFTAELPTCPCSLDQAVADKGRFLSEQGCDQNGKVWDCPRHHNAKHCVRSAMTTESGGAQECCYDIFGGLMMTMDQKWGGQPARFHYYGTAPWNQNKTVPSLSHYLHDVVPFFHCCMWADGADPRSWESGQNDGCITFRLERRPSQTCVGYQPPGMGTVFGDPHFYTFDGMPYTFNGKGEFVLVSTNSDHQKLSVQARFEQVTGPMPNDPEVNATRLTTVAARENMSATVEIQLRPPNARWRYRLNVIVDKHRTYFDRYPQKVQRYQGVTVYTPTYISNQSQVIIMFDSGLGVEVIENKGHMAARVYLPSAFRNKTRGLLGNWSGLIDDDLILPNGTIIPSNISKNLAELHHHFGSQWMVNEGEESQEKETSLFFHENGKNKANFTDTNFQPNFALDPQTIFRLNNVSLRQQDEINDFCEDSYPCKYDYSLTLKRDAGRWAKNYEAQYHLIKQRGLRPIVSCGPIMTPINVRKSTWSYTPGTKVHFDCDPEYVLTGPRGRICKRNGEWVIAPSVWRVKYDPTHPLFWNPKNQTLCIESSEYERINAMHNPPTTPDPYSQYF